MTSSNGSGNLMDEFEEAFQTCLHAITKQESNTGVCKEEVELEVEQTAQKFIDLARQMEAFFLQKRFLISVLKPEMYLKDENQELRHEINRKEIIIQKHYHHLDQWKAVLLDQQQGYNKQNQSVQADSRIVNPTLSSANLTINPLGHVTQNLLQSIPAHHQQQASQQVIQAQQVNQIQEENMQIYMRQSLPKERSQLNSSARILSGPLAYLEKTTSNIDLTTINVGSR